jgi:hypothetical protein
VSAQFYGTFSIQNLLSSIDSSTIVLGAIFIISFAMINFALEKTFKENKSVPRIISFAISLLIVWGLNSSGINYSGAFFFLPSGLIETIWPIALLGILVFLWFKYGFRKGIGGLMLGMGLFLTVIGFFGIASDTGWTITVGITLMVFGGLLWAWGSHGSDDRKITIKI